MSPQRRRDYYRWKSRVMLTARTRRCSGLCEAAIASSQVLCAGTETRTRVESLSLDLLPPPPDPAEEPTKRWPDFFVREALFQIPIPSISHTAVQETSFRIVTLSS